MHESKLLFFHANGHLNLKWRVPAEIHNNDILNSLWLPFFNAADDRCTKKQTTPERSQRMESSAAILWDSVDLSQVTSRFFGRS